jgi:hypothetical protein
MKTLLKDLPIRGIAIAIVAILIPAFGFGETSAVLPVASLSKPMVVDRSLELIRK